MQERKYDFQHSLKFVKYYQTKQQGTGALVAKIGYKSFPKTTANIINMSLHATNPSKPHQHPPFRYLLSPLPPNPFTPSLVPRTVSPAPPPIPYGSPPPEYEYIISAQSCLSPQLLR